MEKNGIETGNPQALRSLVVVFSYHHNNTEKIANTCANVLGAEVKTPQQVKPGRDRGVRPDWFWLGDLQCDIRSVRPYLADRLSYAAGKKAFLFSTYGAPAFAVQTGISSKIITADPGKTAGERVHGHRGIRVCGVEHEQFPEIFRGTQQGQTRCRRPEECGSVCPGHDSRKPGDKGQYA